MKIPQKVPCGLLERNPGMKGRLGKNASEFFGRKQNFLMCLSI
jgi:hypothetical protein